MGGTEKIKADVRIIAATNKNLLFEMKHGRFRQDLYFRIRTFEIHIPPLRERKEDIPMLAEEILKRESRRIGSEKAFAPEALDKLIAYDWPGNIRELENMIRREIIETEGEIIEAICSIYMSNKDKRTRVVNHRMVIETLIRCRGNKSAAAKELGISRQWLYKILSTI